MRVPPNKEAKAALDQLSNGGKTDVWNLGLYYQKLHANWVLENGWPKFDNENFLSEIIKKGANKDTALADEHIERLYYLVRRLKGHIQLYELTERFVTGTGLEHPLEVGFLWHHTLGVPYLPGSSVKGLVRTWVEEWLPEEAANEDAVKRVFGSGAGDGGSSVGSVIFFDALPCGRLLFEPDIMTPHYGPYYKEEEPPGDWNNPTPIPFLALGKKQRFIFFVAPRTTDDAADCTLVLSWLEKALGVLGAGAKTAAGYGSFTRAVAAENAYLEKMQEKEREESEQRRLAAMSPIRRAMELDGYSTDPEFFINRLTVRWLEDLKSDETEETAKKEIAFYLAQWYKEHRPQQWKKPQRKNIWKVRLIKEFYS